MDYTHLIERLETFEERVGIRLDALFADWSDDIYSPPNSTLMLNGEIHPKKGTNILQDIRLVLDIYDSSGRLIANNCEKFYVESFFGFQTFAICTRIPGPNLTIAKIRIYPKTIW